MVIWQEHPSHSGQARSDEKDATKKARRIRDPLAGVFENFDLVAEALRRARDVIAETARGEQLKGESELASAKMEDAQAHFGAIGDAADPNKLAEAGWALSFTRMFNRRSRLRSHARLRE